MNANNVEELVHQHLPLVGHIVRETLSRVPSHVDRDDLTSAGLFALAQAAQGFDAERGVPFTAYAAQRIRGGILDELRGRDWASRSVRRRARELEVTRSQLAVTLGRVPTNADVASATGLSEQQVAESDDDVSRAQVFSLDAGEGALAEVLISAFPDPAAAAEHQERLTYLVAAIAELPDRMRTVVEEYFLAERPMAEIAAELGVTESRISQIRAEALVLLREVFARELEPGIATAPAPRPGGCAARRREAYHDAVRARLAGSSDSRAARPLAATA
ncbi:sigma-70 family RNA polymerase sigma factor [Nocardioides ferulae]|uniref:sigma-70 family RNA polymerase sigma factor n=1 Tax=Nocardioides ferulae TaxID=2340821 RepID=UPI001F0BEAF9|nr:sigma-70 family RNA polymerase sigma factor [Nocardioides ferulae]